MFDYYRRRRREFWGDEKGFDANAFFSKIFPLRKSMHPLSSKETKLLSIWLEESRDLIYTNEWFVEECLIELLHQLSVISHRNYQCKEFIQAFCKDESLNKINSKNLYIDSVAHEKVTQKLNSNNILSPQSSEHASKIKILDRGKYPSLNDRIVYHLQKQLKNISEADDFSYLLHCLACLKIIPSKTFLEEWYSLTLVVMEEFTASQSYSVLKSHTIMRKRPTNENWLGKFRNNIYSQMNEMPINQIINILRNFQTLNIKVDHVFTKRWLDGVTLLLEDFVENSKEFTEKSQQDIFSSLFRLPNTNDIWNNKRFLNASFNASLVAMFENQENFALFKKIFFEVTQFQKTHLYVKIPLYFLLPVLERLTFHFSKLGSHDLASILYTLGRLQVEKSKVEPFLEKAKEYYSTTNKLFDKDTEFFASELRQAGMAQNFFYKKENFYLGIDPSKYPDALNKLQNERKTISPMQKEVMVFLKKYYKGEMQEEVWIDCIYDKTDLFIKEFSLCIESDGASHTFDGIVNQCTELKSYLLLSHNYNLVRLDATRFYSHSKEEYVKNALKDFIDFGSSAFDGSLSNQGNFEQENEEKYNIEISLNQILFSDEYKKIPRDQIYLEWLEEIHSIFKTCGERDFISLLKQLVYLMNIRQNLKHSFVVYKNNNPKFFKTIIEMSLTYISTYSLPQLRDLLYTFSYLDVDIDQKFVLAWCEQANNYISDFTLNDLKLSISSFERLKIDTPLFWKNAWVNRCKEIMNDLDAANLWKLFMYCVRHKVYLTNDWVDIFKKKMFPFLPNMDPLILFSLPKVFSVGLIASDKEFMRQWFARSNDLIDETSNELLIRALYYLGKNHIQIEYLWISKCFRKLEENFSSLSKKDIAFMLYSFTYLKPDLKLIKPLLNATQLHFHNNETFFEKSSNKDDFQKIISAVSYLKEEFGYHLFINMKNAAGMPADSIPGKIN